MPYFIHPSAALSPTAAIADVGCGNGAWLFDLARELPKSVQLHGYDVSLKQAPHPLWRPENVQLTQWDVYEPVPPAAQCNYDLVTLRACLMMVRQQDPGPLIEQLKRLVKPGGSIQWLEMDIYSLRVVKAAEDIETASTQRLLDRLMASFLPFAGSSPGWVARLPQTFEDHGIKNVRTERFTDCTEDLASFHDNYLLSAEEISGFAPDQDEFRELIDQAIAEFEESRRGVAITVQPLMVVGKV